MITIPRMETNPTPARLIREAIEASPFRAPPPTPRQFIRRARIRGAAASAIARFGRAAVNFSNLSMGLGISPTTLKLDFVDMDYLLFDILWLYLGRLYQHAVDMGADRSAGAISGFRAAAAGDEYAILDKQLDSLPDDLRARIADAEEQVRLRLADPTRSIIDYWNTQPAPAPKEPSPTRPQAPTGRMGEYAKAAARQPGVVRPPVNQKEWGERGAPPTPPAANSPGPTG